jgi:hypothetical protein
VKVYERKVFVNNREIPSPGAHSCIGAQQTHIRQAGQPRSPHRFRHGRDSRSRPPAYSPRAHVRFRSRSPSPSRTRTSYQLPTNPSDSTLVSEQTPPEEYENQYDRGGYDHDYYDQYIQRRYSLAVESEQNRHDVFYNNHQWSPYD